MGREREWQISRALDRAKYSISTPSNVVPLPLSFERLGEICPFPSQSWNGMEILRRGGIKTQVAINSEGRRTTRIASNNWKKQIFFFFFSKERDIGLELETLELVEKKTNFCFEGNDYCRMRVRDFISFDQAPLPPSFHPRSIVSSNLPLRVSGWISPL